MKTQSNKKLHKLIFFIVITLTLFNANTNTTSAAQDGISVAVIDSGVDMQHEFIVPHAWTNTLEIADNQNDDDSNGFIDDLFGWNFSEGNNQVINSKLINFFKTDHFRFFEVQNSLSNNTATAEDVAWIREKIKDKKFLAEGMAYGNFIHGTHVAGISIAKSVSNKVMAIKIIPTEINVSEGSNTHSSSSTDHAFAEDNPVFADLRDGQARGLVGVDLVKYLLRGVAKRQMEGMGTVVTYIHRHYIRVANCSFGTGMAQAKNVAETFYREILGETPSETELHAVAQYFLQQLVLFGQEAFARAPNTLFVFAAGNDGSNNDVEATSPTNIKRGNTIAVAATRSATSLANFSNYGKTLVEVAAPGVSIKSSIPGGKYIGLSGTSQAAPTVSNIAAEVINVNPALTPIQVKEIIVKTVDIKSFLRDKVSSSGLVNKARALRAAEYSKSTALANAIASAVNEVKAVKSSNTLALPLKSAHPELEFVLPLQQEFILNNGTFTHN
ncbi:MAG: S8 family serine peptidase [Oligoflexia bacterium]|nr:S8 family serine peptidase [Oligoflexia bacterium]